MSSPDLQLKDLAALLMGRQFAFGNASLYLMIMANTKEPNIGKACEIDFNNVKDLFTKISEKLELPLVEIFVTGDDFTKTNILSAIDGIEPKKNDAVIFYYSGHGFSFEEDEKVKYPQLDLRSNPRELTTDAAKANTENVSKVYEMIKSKGARLNLVIGDCCNSFIDAQRSVAHTGEVTVKEMAFNNMDMCRKFFFHSKSNILAAAASKGQFALTDDAIGSIYTSTLIAAFKEMIDSDGSLENFTWETLLEAAKTETLALSSKYDCGNTVPCVQEAIYKVEDN